MTTTEADSTALTRGAGPLTTVFTTPDFCSSLYWTDTVTPPLSSIVCMPPRFHQLWAYSWGFYSPGICPTGYTTGCAFPRSIASTSLGMVYYGGPVLDGEGVQLCCPTGYQCLASGTSSYSRCVATSDPSDFVYGIQVRWQESDLSVLQTDPTVPGSKFSAQATATATAASSGSMSTTLDGGASSGSSPTVVGKETGELSSTATLSINTTVAAAGSSSALTSGATIGIAVGSMALAFGLSALVFFIWRSRRRKREEMNGTLVGSSLSLDKMEPPPPIMMKPELDSSTVVPNSPVPSELQGGREVAEMPVPHFVAELPGSMPSGYSYRQERQDSLDERGVVSTRGESADWGSTFETVQEISTSSTPVEANNGHCRRRSTRDSF